MKKFPKFFQIASTAELGSEMPFMYTPPCHKMVLWQGGVYNPLIKTEGGIKTGSTGTFSMVREDYVKEAGEGEEVHRPIVFVVVLLELLEPVPG